MLFDWWPTNLFISVIIVFVLLHQFSNGQTITTNLRDGPVKVFEGDCRYNSISLPCVTTSRSGTQSVVWEKQHPTEDRYLIIFTNTNPGVLGQDPRYSVTDGSTNNSFTLYVNDINCNDTGLYRCRIALTLPSQQLPYDVQVGKCSKDKIKCTEATKSITCSSRDTKPEPLLKLYDNVDNTLVDNSSIPAGDSGNFTSVNCSTTPYDASVGPYFPTENPFSYRLEVELDGVVAHELNGTFTVESTTADPSTDGPVTGSTTVTVTTTPAPTNPPLSTGAIVGIVCGCGVVLIVVIVVLVILLCPCSCCPRCPCASKGNVPYEFEIDGIKKDKTIEISAGIPIKLAATCYGAKPPAAIQWCISYNGKEPRDITEDDYGKAGSLKNSVTTNKRDPKTSDTHCELEMVPNVDHDGAVIHCIAITKISPDEAKWDLKTSPKITLSLKLGNGKDGGYQGQDGYNQGQGVDYHRQGGNYHVQDGQAGQNYPRVMYDNASNVTKIPIGNYRY